MSCFEDILLNFSSENLTCFEPGRAYLMRAGLTVSMGILLLPFEFKLL